MTEDVRSKVTRIYCTNGWMWALFELNDEGLAEPLDIFHGIEAMWQHARHSMRPVQIEFRPQELGCEMSDDEREVTARLAEMFDITFARLFKDTAQAGALPSSEDEPPNRMSDGASDSPD